MFGVSGTYRINCKNNKGPSTDTYRTYPPLKTGTLSEEQPSTATLGSAKKEVCDLLLGVPWCHRGVASRVNWIVGTLSKALENSKTIVSACTPLSNVEVKSCWRVTRSILPRKERSFRCLVIPQYLSSLVPCLLYWRGWHWEPHAMM